MKRENVLTIIDVGSHKLEELFILLNPNKNQYLTYMKWAMVKVLKAIKKLDFVKLLRSTRQLKIIQYYFLKKKTYDIKIISIEPNIDVAYKYVKILARKYPVYYIPVAVLGHDAIKRIELKKLFFYDKTISNSIYRKDRPIDEGKSTICVGLKFGILWDELIKENIIDGSDPFLLRMNCEGSELGVIEECRDKNLTPLCIIGSLGDIAKIHGTQLGDKARKILGEMGVPYFYYLRHYAPTVFFLLITWS